MANSHCEALYTAGRASLLASDITHRVKYTTIETKAEIAVSDPGNKAWTVLLDSLTAPSHAQANLQKLASHPAIQEVLKPIQQREHLTAWPRAFYHASLLLPVPSCEFSQDSRELGSDTGNSMNVCRSHVHCSYGHLLPVLTMACGTERHRLCAASHAG